MEKLEINPKQINILFLSHVHDNHVGGLFGLLDRNSDLEVFLPASFPLDFKNKIKSI